MSRFRADYRSQLAWNLRQQGMTFAQIAAAVGRADDSGKPISRSRARQMVLRYERSLKPGPFRGLSVRAEWALRRAGISTKQEARGALANGGAVMLFRMGNCGRVTVNEIIRWAFSDDAGQPYAVEECERLLRKAINQWRDSNAPIA